MTYYQAIVARLTERFSPENVITVNPEILAADIPLVEALEKLEIELSQQDKDYINMWPRGLQQAVRWATHAAVDRPEEERLAVTFGGAPSSFFEVTIWETSGGMAIQFRGPVPF
ncbi:MAG: hypothetical protein WD379_01625 [Dehalococcoidia bacterium]